MNQSENFDEVYREHAAAVFRFCLRAVSRREVAEELTSEVFLALHQKWPLPQEQLPAWLFTVAKRRAADYWRRRYIEDRWEVEQQAETTLWAEPEHTLSYLLASCSTLKPIHRVCLTLRFAQGMSRAEIAKEMRLSELQVKGHLQYSLQLLREFMARPQPQGGVEDHV